jgi:hypothetical protein
MFMVVDIGTRRTPVHQFVINWFLENPLAKAINQDGVRLL